jgi:hypothetical protein
MTLVAWKGERLELDHQVGVSRAGRRVVADSQ